MTLDPPSLIRQWSFTNRFWLADVATTVGLGRRRQEDAWEVAMQARMGRNTVDAFAVFDGVGGHPGGARASRAAAGALRQALASCGRAHGVLAGISEAVLPTEGLTTGVAFIADQASGGAWVASAGDSSAYVLRDGELGLVSARDVHADGSLANWLGTGFRGARTVTVPRPASLLLCTDGVDKVASQGVLRQALRAGPSSGRRAMDLVVDEIVRRGAPDNATLILVKSCSS